MVPSKHVVGTVSLHQMCMIIKDITIISCAADTLKISKTKINGITILSTLRLDTVSKSVS